MLFGCSLVKLAVWHDKALERSIHDQEPCTAHAIFTSSVYRRAYRSIKHTTRAREQRRVVDWAQVWKEGDVYSFFSRIRNNPGALQLTRQWRQRRNGPIAVFPSTSNKLQTKKKYRNLGIEPWMQFPEAVFNFFSPIYLSDQRLGYDTSFHVFP